VHTHPVVNRWTTATVARHRGGRIVVPREHAPLAPVLPYRRAAGDHPASTGSVGRVQRAGWSVDLGDRGLGDVLLGLGLVRALVDAASDDGELHYHGPRPRLMQRCRLPLHTTLGSGPHTVHNGHRGGISFPAIPEQPQPWLDLLDDERVEVHAPLPMRYYLAAEQALGLRLPADHEPLPTFAATEPARSCHVVFVTATSWPGRKDYGPDRFADVARILTERRTASWMFTLITGTDVRPPQRTDVEVLVGPDAVDCLDVFASAEVVIGNDTGLTHLAALTERPDGTSPHVIGLYGRHAYTKWTTGRRRHHAIATPFSRMLAAADRCPVRDHLDDSLWCRSASLADLPAELIADFAGELAGWW
jgi:Glycosyltransferase family 9 (heptosyltransferase)